jgi:uncharacterized beta-barrel protein YwiB (DUF1934 family)
MNVIRLYHVEKAAHILYTIRKGWWNGMKRSVRIDIESRSAGQGITQSAQGELYLIGEQLVLRYAESDPSLGRTTTTMKIDPGEIKVIRHGDVESEQSYRPGQTTRGTLRTGGAILSLEKRTHEIQCDMDERGGTIRWSYDMIMNGEPAGVFELCVIAAVIDEDLEAR